MDLLDRPLPTCRECVDLCASRPGLCPASSDAFRTWPAAMSALNGSSGVGPNCDTVCLSRGTSIPS